MRFAVLVSGRGSNLGALLDAEAAGQLAPGEIAVVVSNRPGAAALARASAAGKATETVDHKAFASREAFETALLACLDAHRVEAIILAGFMRVLTGHFLRRFPDRVLNIHPSLLPAFPGIDGPAQALAHGAKLAGCTVHFVDESLDGGAIIAQAAVPVRDDDDATSLAARILAEEHRLLPAVARALAAGQITRQGRRVSGAPC